MQLNRAVLSVLGIGLACGVTGSVGAQQSVAVSDSNEIAVSKSFPDAPAPAHTVPDAGTWARETQAAQEPQQAGPQQSPPSPAPDAEKTRRQKAEDQIGEQEHQRVLGILPAFNTSYRADAVSLTGAQKVRLAFRSTIDPVTFATAFLMAGFREANADYGGPGGYGWGISGYGKRAGAAYLDAFDGTMIGNGILPALLHQDPRYFRLGHGSVTHRILYAAATSVICKHDNTHKWEPNYSNVAGNIASGAISNLYYPASESGWGETIGNGMIVTGEGTLGGIFQEFWPDISRKFLHKDPTHGLDAQAREADRAKLNEKQRPLDPSPK